MSALLVLACPVPLALAPAPAAPQDLIRSPRWLEETEAGEVRSLGDIDLDGDVDLLLFEGPGPYTGFRALLNDGSGSFPTAGPLTPLAVSYGTVDSYGEQELRDVTGDGWLDVLMVENGFSVATIHVFPGGPGATFSPTSIPIPFVGALTAIDQGDIEGDGVYEIATAEETPSPGGLFLNDDVWVRWHRFNGTGFDATPAHFILGESDSPKVGGIAHMDTNGDGQREMIVGEYWHPNLRVLELQANTPVLIDTVPVGLPDGPGDFARLVPQVGDLAGGGEEDLFVYDEDTGQGIPVLQTPSGLVVGTPQALPFGTFGPFTAKAGWSYELADWDGDGLDDLLQFPGHTTSSANTYFLTLWRNDGANLFVDESKIGTRTADYYGGGAADFDGDGSTDFAATNALVDGDGRFRDQAYATDSFYGSLHQIAMDWDGDGDVDSVRTDGFIRFNDGAGTFTAQGIFPPPIAPPFYYEQASALGDFDGDGDVDFLTPAYSPGSVFDPPTFQQLRQLWNDGQGNLVDVGPAGNPGMFINEFGDVADFDGDGDLDVTDLEGAGEGWRENNGFGFFQNFHAAWDSSPLSYSDADLDGDVDVYTVESSGGGSTLYLNTNDGSGVFTKTAIHAATPIFPSSVTPADLDVNGTEDVAFSLNQWSAPTTPASLRFLSNDGSASYTFAGSVDTKLQPGSLSSPLAQHLLFADYDGDGILDLLGAPSGGSGLDDMIVVHRGLGGGFSYGPYEPHVGFRVDQLADFDEDGDPDVYGAGVLRSPQFDGIGAGEIRQYGAGSPGTGGTVPVLGLDGPLRPGNLEAEMRLVWGLPGATGLLAVGLNEVAFVDVPVPGMTTYVDPIIAFLPIALDGNGVWTFPMGGLLVGAAGLTFTHQGVVIDPGAPIGFSVTNGLALTYGL